MGKVTKWKRILSKAFDWLKKNKPTPGKMSGKLKQRVIIVNGSKFKPESLEVVYDKTAMIPSDYVGKLEYLVIHCTATPMDMKVTKKHIYQWHIVERGWSRMGYSDLIWSNGYIENITPYNEDQYVTNDEMTWGVSGHNKNTRHICIVGGLDKNKKDADTLTAAQAFSIANIILRTVRYHPNIKIVGHNYFTNAKSCPNFDVPAYLELLGVPEKNIGRK